MRDSASHRVPAAIGFGAAVAGGTAGWSLAWFTNGDLEWLLCGAALTVALVGVAALGRQQLHVLLSYASAFVVITWPLLYLAVGYVRYLITGQALGD